MTDPKVARFNPLKTMPNLLTVSRVCLAPFLVSAIFERRFMLAFLLFLVAGITDGLDGALARILKQRTVLGQYLDPIADKLLMSTLFLVLTHMSLIPTRVTVLVFGRDLGILVVAAILYVATGRRDFKPSLVGKANTVAEICAIAFVLLRQIDPDRWITMGKTFALQATVCLTVASGLQYAWMITRRGASHSGASAGSLPPTG